MSEEKVLTLRGKKAVWAPAPAGVGGAGGVLNVVIIANDNGTATCNATYQQVDTALTNGTLGSVMLIDLGQYTKQAEPCGLTYASGRECYDVTIFSGSYHPYLISLNADGTVSFQWTD